VVARAREVLAVALGASYRDAADGAHRRSAEAVAKLVSRFNHEGLAALEPHGRGGPKPHYDAQARERILAEARRTPDPELDGTANWSLMTLRRALRRAPDGLCPVSAPIRLARCSMPQAIAGWPRAAGVKRAGQCESGAPAR
jgi:transposase